MLNDSSHPDRNPDLIKECAKGYGQTGEKCVLALEKLGYHAIASLLTATAVQVENLPNEVTFPMLPQQCVNDTCAAISDAFITKSRQPLITQSEVFEVFNEAGCQVLEQALGLDPFGDH